MTQDRTPGYQDAELLLRLYELRREEVMRRSRDTISFSFWPTCWDDVLEIMDFSHPDNAAWRQVGSFWEMVFGFGTNGIMAPEFLVENNGEGILFYMKVRPFLGQMRTDRPTAYANLEWAATQTEAGRQMVEFFDKRFGDKLGKA